MANTNDLYEMPRPTLAKVVNIGGVGMESRDAKPLEKEAIRGGVPVISIPLFGDQPKNARLAEHHGFGLVLHRAELSVSTLSKAIHKVIENPKYTNSAQRLSQMIERQPVSPVQLLIKWLEFVAEFKTLENLEPSGNKLNFFQYHSLDVIAFLTSIVVVILLLSVKIASLVWRFVSSKISKITKHKIA
ncbi:hypothetical protein TELCIR_05526 [Teladorsagia circumcincta]|uniref:glucuronosyltransferase n=1 Tax=Teladorsagia circumcincta TaxID=45464 RepID=A0A2G9UQV6_TELCI|nr:hypothetical protein TELCIR_05526 [Teladorsagia circumcincta]